MINWTGRQISRTYGSGRHWVAWSQDGGRTLTLAFYDSIAIAACKYLALLFRGALDVRADMETMRAARPGQTTHNLVPNHQTRLGPE